VKPPDGLDAVRIGRALKPDLAILDVGMPGLTGIEAATILRYSMPKIRIVLVSLHSDDLYQTLCKTLTSTIHIDAVISKSGA
jgi:DNA-binding NarL/FixJ family response regulator